jgi:N-acetylglucosaminyldiphosphoundecaprenol N-acetyl-beta-D-mannosaminyltransferase
MKRVIILGIPIDALTRSQAVERIKAMLGESRFHHVMTPNSEMLVEASKNQSFHQLLNRTDLNIADSAGLVWAARTTHQHLPERVTGVDTVTDLCTSLSSDHPVFLLGAWDDTAKRAGEIFKQKNPQLVIAGALSGSPKDPDAADIIKQINDSGAHVLLVAFGAPKQDMWIDRYRNQLTTVRVAIGVGGTFDFIAGVHKRAPVIFQNLGIEWLWRVVREPRRIGRIINAVIVFPLSVIRYQTGNGKRKTDH